MILPVSTWNPSMPSYSWSMMSFRAMVPYHMQLDFCAERFTHQSTINRFRTKSPCNHELCRSDKAVLSRMFPGLRVERILACHIHIALMTGGNFLGICETQQIFPLGWQKCPSVRRTLLCMPCHITIIIIFYTERFCLM
jgi:hypothetical protein